MKEGGNDGFIDGFKNWSVLILLNNNKDVIKRVLFDIVRISIHERRCKWLFY